MMVATPVTSLYLHVPFCVRKCAYCAFYSEPAQKELMGRYVDALLRELELVAAHPKPQTVFFGGGTPSQLNARQWQRIFRVMDRLGLLGAAEWTIECNPATLSSEKVKLWREYGVNRVSLGVQSFNDELLSRLGRVHTRVQAFRAFELLSRSFDNLNLDLMFAIPGQSLESWRATVNEAVSLGSQHLSCYEVIYEEDTPLFTQLRAGRFACDENLACAMYEELLERAAAHGFKQYEVANFARVAAPGGAEPADIPDRACRHNVNYWRGGAYYGLGPGAVSYVGGVRSKNWPDTLRYCEALERGESAVEWKEELPALRRAGETAAFGLRMNAGWPFREFTSVTGFDLRQEWAADMDSLATRGWGQIEAHRFRLTSEGLRFADAAAECFLR